MANFSDTNISPIQGGQGLRSPASVPVTPSGPDSTVSAISAGASGLAQLGKVGMQILQMSNKREQAQVMVDFQNDQMNLVEGVQQGVYTSTQAQSLMRANIQKYSAAHPSYAEEFLNTNGKIVSDAGLGKIVTEGTPEEKLKKQVRDEAYKAGFISPSTIGTPKEQEDVKNYLEFKRGSENLQRASQELTYAKGLMDYDTGKISQQRAAIGLAKDKIEYQAAGVSLSSASLSLQMKGLEFQSQKALATMSGAYYNKMTNDLSEIDKMLQTGQITREQAVMQAKINYNTILQAETQAGTFAPGMVDPLTRSHKELTDTYVKYFSGETSKDVLTNTVDTNLAKQKAFITANPQYSRTIATSNLLGNSNLVASAVSSDNVLKILSDNSYAGGRSADLVHKNKNEESDVRSYLNVISGNIDAVNKGTRKDVGPVEEELKTQLGNVFSSIKAYGPTATDAKELNAVTDFIAGSGFGVYASRSGGIPKEMLQPSKEVLQQYYGDVVLPLIKKRFDEGGVYALTKSDQLGRTIPLTPNPTSSLVEVKFSGSGVTFQPISNLPKDLSPNEVAAKVKGLNKEVAPVLNKLVHMYAHLDGNTDYQKAWNESLAPKFEKPIIGEDNVTTP